MAHFTYLVIFHLKMIVCQMLIYHIFMVIALKNIHLQYNHYQTFYMAHKFIQSYGITMFSKYYKFHKK
jgi:hypothetical protein